MSKFSVKKPYTVVVAVLILLILGIVSFTKLSTDLLPSMELPYAIVLTTYPGASPEQVEMVITEPVESSMATISNIKHITSTSSENMSMVVLEFNDKANMDSVTIEMRESLDMISSYWPDAVGSPIIMKLNPDMLPVMMASLSGEGMSVSEVTKMYNDVISQEINSIDGVASVSATGLVESSIHVVLSEEKVKALNEKMLKSIDKKFDEAQEEIDDAKKEIEDGKKSLESGKKTAAGQMAQAEKQLQQGKDEVAIGQTQLAIKLSEIEAQEKQLLEAEKQLGLVESQLSELSKQEETLKAQKSALEQTITTLKNQKAQIEMLKAGYDAAGGDEKYKQLLAQRDQLKEQINQVQNNTVLSDAQKEAQLENLNKSLTQLNQAISEMEMAKAGIEQLPAIDAGLSQAENGLPQIESGLSQITSAKETIIKQVGDIEAQKQQIQVGKAAISEGKKAIADAQAQIDAGKLTMNEAMSQLSTQKALATIEMSVAQSQLLMGEMQLEQSLTQIDDAKTTAKEQADMTQILTSDMIKGILTAQNFSMPAGYITEDGVDYLIRVGDKIKDVESMEDLVLLDLSEQDLGLVYLKDVAEVATVDNSSEVYAKMNGMPAVMLSVEKQNGYSTADVAKKVREYFESDQAKAHGVSFTILMDQGVYIDLVVDSVLNNLVIGAILAIIILFLFLKDLRPTVVVAVSIPVSVIFALTLMYFSGVTMNIISLSGLALGVGMLVDNSIVVIENIYRLRNEGMPIRKASIAGAKQVTGAIAASTLTTVCIWAPIIFVEGMTRQIFMDLVLTIAYSLLASLVVALTVVPMMSSKLLKKQQKASHPLFTKLQNAYEKSLRFTLKHKLSTIVIVVVLLVASIMLVLVRGFEFMGTMDSPQISVSVSMDDDTTFDEAVETGDAVLEAIMKVDGVSDAGAMLGSSLSMVSSMGGKTATNSLSVYVILDENRKLSSEQIADAIMENTKDLDCEVSASASTMDMSALGGSGVSVMIKGREIDTLKEIATDFAEILEGIEGTVDVSDGQELPSSEIRISVNKEKAMAHSLTVAQVYQQIQALVSDPAVATSITLNSEDLDVTVTDDTRTTMTLDDLKALKLTSTDASGKEEKVALTDLAEITQAEGLSSIKRDAQQRQLTVSAGVDSEHNATLIANEFKAAIKDITLPDGYSIEFSGENETIQESFEQLGLLLVLGILIMYLIMVAQFQSLLSPFIVMFTIPLAFTGGFLGLFLTGNRLSVIGMVGFVMLCGIIVNNGIVFVDYVNQLRAKGMHKKEALVETGKTRLRPILMTALTTIFAMSTMALGIGDGSEMVQPMAIVTIGGMIYGTILTLFLVPAIYDIFNRKEYINIEAETVIVEGADDIDE